MRNMSRGKGIGFFEAGNFYPDFTMWLLADDRQYVAFIDPKGLRNLDGPDDPKLAFYKTIKQTEQQLGDPKVILSSFIVSPTPYHEVRSWKKSKDELAERHVLFQQEEKATYVETMLRLILGQPAG